MYRCVATINEENGSVAVEMITKTGSMLPKIVYESIEDVPEEFRDKIKQLKWVAEDDQGVLEDVGTRIGKNLFWVC